MIFRLLSILRGRLAMNILFWVLLISADSALNYVGGYRYNDYPAYLYLLFATLTTGLLATLLYSNNLWLIPKFLIKRKYLKYFLLLFGFLYGTGLSYAILFRFIDQYFPKITTLDVAIFSTYRITGPSFWIVFAEAFCWMIVFSIVLFLFTMAWYMRDYTRQTREVEAIQKKQIESELLFLKSQLNPHFLFNTLNNLYSLTIKKSDNASEVVSKLSDILRYLLYESNVPQVDFEKEREIMQAYIDLELLRLPKGNNLNFSITADGPYRIPPLLWLTTLENVFKHGTAYISSEYYLDYRFSIEKNVITIFSKNHYKPAMEKPTGKKEGIGLKNLEKRLSLLYPNKHRTTVDAGPDFYITTVKINLD